MRAVILRGYTIIFQIGIAENIGVYSHFFNLAKSELSVDRGLTIFDSRVICYVNKFCYLWSELLI